ncbi:MAG: AEC family transporter [Amphritea sp.]
MSELNQVFNITGPVFAIIAIGYLAIKYSILSRDASKSLAGFTVNFALPALLFKAISERPLSQLFNSDYLLVYAGGSLLSFTALFLIYRKLRQEKLAASAIFAMGGSFSNSLMIGYPVILQLFGNAALAPLALTLMVENFIMMPLALTLAETGRNTGSDRVKLLLTVLLRVIRNPIIMAIICGVIFSFSGLQLPVIILKVVDSFALTVSGVALFAIGGMLVGIKIRLMLTDISLIMASKLIVHPLMILLMISLVPQISKFNAAVALILASMPMFGIFPVIGQKYGVGQACAAVLVPTTIASFISLNIVIWLVGI